MISAVGGLLRPWLFFSLSFFGVLELIPEATNVWTLAAGNHGGR
jgi:hypothetical protein